MILIDHTILLLYFTGNTKAAKIIDLINEGKEEGYICEVSILELIDRLSRVFENGEVARRIEGIKNSNLKIIGFDYETAKRAIKIKRMHNLSIFNAYIIALATHLNATLVTADKRLVVEGVNVEYIEPLMK